MHQVELLLKDILKQLCLWQTYYSSWKLVEWVIFQPNIIYMFKIEYEKIQISIHWLIANSRPDSPWKFSVFFMVMKYMYGVCPYYTIFLCKITYILMGIKIGKSEYSFCALNLSVLDLCFWRKENSGLGLGRFWRSSEWKDSSPVGCVTSTLQPVSFPNRQSPWLLTIISSTMLSSPVPGLETSFSIKNKKSSGKTKTQN